MQPEPGDRSIQVTSGDVAAACAEVGIGPGDVAMFHSSLSSMGHVLGGPNAVIDGFLQAVGPAGTVCVPTLWWYPTDPPRLWENWDPDTCPSYPGVITETFRRRPDSVRSDNPTHSVSAIGPRAADLVAGHGTAGLRPCIFGDRAFARVSPWQRLWDWNAAYCFVGVDFSVNTMGHLCESEFALRALERCPAEKREALDARLGRWENPKELSAALRASYDFRAMGERLAEMGLVRVSRIGSATLRCIRTQDMVPAILGVLEAEPERWLNEGFLAWLRDAR